MKRMIKHLLILTALVAMFALLSVAAYADEPDPFDRSLVFATETQLTVYVDDQWSSALSGVYGFGDKATITADSTINGKTFSHWVAEGSIISYSRRLDLTMNAHTTLYAVYATAAPTAKPVTGFTSITRTNDGESISFQAIASGDTAGIIYSTTTTGNNLKIEGSDVTQVAAVKYNALPDGGENTRLPASVLDKNNCWMLIITPDSKKNENKDTVYHARAYVTVDGTTTYGDVKDVKLSDLESGIWMVANLEGFEPGTNDTLAGLTGKLPTGGNGGSGGNGSSGNGGSGGSSSGTATTVTVPVTGDSGTVSVSVSVKDKDATVAPLTEKQVDSIVGTGSTASTVEIDASSLGKEITTVTIPADTVKVIEAAVSSPDKDAESLTVKLSEGSITFDAEALKTIAEQTKGDGLKVNLDDIGTEKLNTAQKTAVSDLTVESVLDAYVTSGSTRISDFKGGSATVSVKHTLKADQRPAGIVVWYVADNGTRTQIPATFRGGEVVFTVTHFSNYVIAYDAEKAAAAGKLGAFIDLDSSAWYADGVLWALDNGVMEGVGNNRFSPNGDTTRAMVVTMLWRMEGSPAYAGASEFTDVDADTWYTEAVRWASTEGIVTGYENPDDAGMIFNPNGAVTREQLATMLYRYAQYKKADVSANASLSSYGDAASVSSWAASAMQWAVGSGIINGIDGNLAPVNHATRAQVATMLMRYSTAK